MHKALLLSLSEAFCWFIYLLRKLQQTRELWSFKVCSV